MPLSPCCKCTYIVTFKLQTHQHRNHNRTSTQCTRGGAHHSTTSNVLSDDDDAVDPAAADTALLMVDANTSSRRNVTFHGNLSRLTDSLQHHNKYKNIISAESAAFCELTQLTVAHAWLRLSVHMKSGISQLGTPHHHRQLLQVRTMELLYQSVQLFCHQPVAVLCVSAARQCQLPQLISHPATLLHTMSKPQCKHHNQHHYKFNTAWVYLGQWQCNQRCSPRQGRPCPQTIAFSSGTPSHARH